MGMLVSNETSWSRSDSESEWSKSLLGVTCSSAASVYLLDIGLDLELLDLLGLDLDFGPLACFWVVTIVDPDLHLGLELTALQEDLDYLDLSLALETYVSSTSESIQLVSTTYSGSPSSLT